MALVLLPDVSIDFHFKVKALGVVDPIYSLAPGSPVALLMKQLIKLLLSPLYVLLRRVDYKIIVLSEDGNESGFF